MVDLYWDHVVMVAEALLARDTLRHSDLARIIYG